MNQPLYTTEILRLAASLPPFEPLEGASGSAEKRAVTCGSTIRADVRTDTEGRVVALAQLVRACAFGQASAALTHAAVVGRDLMGLRVLRGGLQEWLAGRSDDAGVFAPLAPARDKAGRHGAMLLSLDAVIAAVEVSIASLDCARDERT